MLEIVGRVAVVYIALTVLLRISGRREMSELRPMDLLTMLLISETVSPALTGGDQSLAGGLLAVVTLIGLSVATSVLTYRSRRAERLLEGSAVLLIRDGVVDPRVMRRFRITDADLRAALRQNGHQDIDEVARAYVESDGKISVLAKDEDEGEDRPPTPDRTPAPRRPVPGPA